MIDSTIVKAHRMASSMLTDKLPREIGRSVGSLTTKIHLMATIEQIPLDFSLTGGQVNDSKEGEEIIKKNCPRFEALLADKGYDTNKIRSCLSERPRTACIPAKSNRKNPASHDRELYKKRSIIENMFGRLKDWNRFCIENEVFPYNKQSCPAASVFFMAVFLELKKPPG